MNILIAILLFSFCWGCALGTVGLYFLMWREVNLIFKVILALVFLPMVAILVLAPFLILAKENSLDLALLKKQDWECALSHDESKMVMVGKVLIPRTVTVCDQYSRKPAT